MSDDKKMKVNVDAQTAFLLGAALGKEKVQQIANAWVEKNPIPAAKAWAERNPDEATNAWSEGTQAMQAKVNAWVENNPDQVAKAWVEENAKHFHKAAPLNESDPHANAWYDEAGGPEAKAWYEVS